jgi:aquaporin rerated protein, invertebrate
MATITDFIISIIFITSCCFLAQIARKVINRLSSINGFVKELFMEAIAAAELCSTCFELIIGENCDILTKIIVCSFSIFNFLFHSLVADNFGVATYAIVLFVLTLWWSQVWDTATACPYTHMEDMIEGTTSPRDMALKTWAQLMGGCCVWRFIQFFWWLEIAQTHKGKAFEDCNADLQVYEHEQLTT